MKINATKKLIKKEEEFCIMFGGTENIAGCNGMGRLVCKRCEGFHKIKLYPKSLNEEASHL